MTSPSVTIVRCSLGTSMPMSDLPGIGASTRTVAVASASARSSASAVTRLTLTPFAIFTSKSVTVGPAIQSSTRDGMSKVASVDSMTWAVPLSSLSEAREAAAFTGLTRSSDSGGNSKPAVSRGVVLAATGAVRRSASGSGRGVRGPGSARRRSPPRGRAAAASSRPGPARRRTGRRGASSTSPGVNASVTRSQAFARRTPVASTTPTSIAPTSADVGDHRAEQARRAPTPRRNRRSRHADDRRRRSSRCGRRSAPRRASMATGPRTRARGRLRWQPR